MKIYLCGKGHCPAVEVHADRVLIVEEGNTIALTRDQWNALVNKIEKGELGRI